MMTWIGKRRMTMSSFETQASGLRLRMKIGGLGKFEKEDQDHG